jgi:hypothetical protein
LKREDLLNLLDAWWKSKKDTERDEALHALLKSIIDSIEPVVQFDRGLRVVPEGQEPPPMTPSKTGSYSKQAEEDFWRLMMEQQKIAYERQTRELAERIRNSPPQGEFTKKMFTINVKDLKPSEIAAPPISVEEITEKIKQRESGKRKIVVRQKKPFDDPPF